VVRLTEPVGTLSTPMIHACKVNYIIHFKGGSVKADLHSAEEYRLATLRSYGILDTPREEDFDEVVKVASRGLIRKAKSETQAFGAARFAISIAAARSIYSLASLSSSAFVSASVI
jgi:hypothetical protein